MADKEDWTLMFDPKDPDTYFKAFNQMKSEAAELQATLLAEADKVKVDAFDFFETIRAQQIGLTELQKALHENVLEIEENWAKAETVEASHRQYEAAIDFFSRNAESLQSMTKKMQNLTEKVAEISPENGE